MIYYHVCEHWDGGDLESLYARYGQEAYQRYAERWPEAGELAQYHVHVIHLHSSLEEAEEYQEAYGGEILVIDDPDDELEVVTDDLEYPHPVVRGRIEARFVKPVNNGKE